MRAVLTALLVLSAGLGAWADPNADPIEIRRTTGGIDIDGDLGDPGWRGATRVNTWYETRPGDNVPPKVGNTGYLAYDDRFLYVALELADPQPEQIRAPLGDRDNVPSYTDYGGVLIDANDDGKSAQMFLANPRGIQYDAISNDATGEDSSPDFYWDSAGSITAEGWVLELRIPFSSLRYRNGNPERWGILLYRNYPRDHRYQMFTSQLPRDVNCFICNCRPLVGLADLPTGSHWVVAPYASATLTAEPTGELGTPLASGEVESEVGLDAKWIPRADTVVDATLNPDFSQIEADVPQISANERFALFFPEKRPFFLEGIDLFTTPFKAVYTRTFTSPRWGLRGTGTLGSTTYTALVGEDRGGGSVIVPGAALSQLVEQDYASTVAMARVRHDLGRSFVSFLYSGREIQGGEIDGGGSNRVFGPDFEWRPTEQDIITGQLLLSRSETPNRSDLADEWDGRSLSGHALELWWNRSTATWDYFLLYNDIHEEFRADNGYVPRAGLRRGVGEIGRTFWRADKKIPRLRIFCMADYIADRDGWQLERHLQPGFGFDSLWSSFVRFELGLQEVRVGDTFFGRNQLRTYVELSPGQRFSFLRLETTVGQEIDYRHGRPGDGVNLDLQANLRPTDHLELAINAGWRRLDVELEEGGDARLFTAAVARLRAVYTYNARSWLRLISEWAEVDRDPALYEDEVENRSAGLGASLVFAYKLNWQTVLYLGYADRRELSLLEQLEPASREAFLKISYALQR